ncbi:MAG: hypothetical protein GX478_00870 [Erysipelotrichaceae bacterium]|jgi:hypothetical protein|nr:hypothetical protein [Erysipelotrichaceae bacterium]
MIFRDAMHSLLKDRTKAFFYWLILVLTTVFICMFFSISTSDPSVDPLHNSDNKITIVTALVLVLCSIDILFANEYYVKLKSKELAVRLLCGAKFTQTSAFLLYQTVMLLLLAIPCGILLACMLLPLANQVMMAQASGFLITMNAQAILQSAVVILYVVFWIVLLNFSFAYRNSVGQLMNPSTVTMNETSASVGMPSVIKIPSWVEHTFWILLFFVPAAVFYIKQEYIPLAAFVGAAGIYGILTKKMKPVLNSWIRKRETDHPLRLASIGMFRKDLYILRFNIILFIVSATILAALLAAAMDQPIAMMTIFVSYLLMTFMQAMALMFRFGSEISTRCTDYRILRYNGCTSHDCRTVMKQEVRMVYGAVLLAALFYISNILISYTIHGSLTWHMTVLMILTVLLALLFGSLLNQIMYRRLIEESQAIQKNE